MEKEKQKHPNIDTTLGTGGIRVGEKHMHRAPSLWGWLAHSAHKGMKTSSVVETEHSQSIFFDEQMFVIIINLLL